MAASSNIVLQENKDVMIGEKRKLTVDERKSKRVFSEITNISETGDKQKNIKPAGKPTSLETAQVSNNSLESSVDSVSANSKKSAKRTDESSQGFPYFDPGEPETEYCRDIIKYLKTREQKFLIGDYIAAQLPGEVTTWTRLILVSWMFKLQYYWSLEDETLHTAVKIVDMYLSKRQLMLDRLQLLGITSVMISCKMEEIPPPNLADCVHVCREKYSENEICEMEVDVLCTLNFDISFPLSYSFLMCYAKACRASEIEYNLGKYILDMSLLDYTYNVKLPPSHLAAAALLLAYKIQGVEDGEAIVEDYTGYKISDLKDTVMSLHQVVLQPPSQPYNTVRKKYNSEAYLEVATIPLPEYLQFE